MKDEGIPDLVERTTEFALRVVRMFVALPLHNSTFNLHPFPTMTDLASHPPQSSRDGGGRRVGFLNRLNHEPGRHHFSAFNCVHAVCGLAGSLWVRYRSVGIQIL